MHEDEEITLSNEQIEKLEIFYETTGEAMPDNVRELYLIARHISAFDNDPIMTANAWNDACEKASEAMAKVYEEMHAHIPKPVAKHLYDFFDTKEDAENYKKKVKKAGAKAFSRTLKLKFWDELDRRLTLLGIDPHETMQ